MRRLSSTGNGFKQALMNLSLQGKYFLISGGAKGIGAGVSRVLAAEGAIPLIADRDEKAAAALCDDLRRAGCSAFFIPTELTDPESCRAAVEQATRIGDRLDGLVNNAGVNDGVGLETGDYQRFMASMHKNLIHYYLLAHHALPALKATKGAIVNITSKTAETGQGNTSAYAAANGGRNALTREWAVELLPYGIRVNAVVVAECWTPMYADWLASLPDPEAKRLEIERRIPLEHRMTTAEEIGHTVAFLLSPRSAHTTGQLIHVDGGYVHLDRAV
jgi:L-fucose dehydrogenase